MANRCIKRKIAELEKEFEQGAPKLTAWSSVEVLSSSQVQKLAQLKMTGNEMEEAGVSPYSFTDPSELPAKVKMLSTLPQLEKEIGQTKAECDQYKRVMLGELHLPWKMEFVLAVAAALAAVLSCLPQHIQLGVLVSFIIVLGSWFTSLGAALSKQLELLTELQFDLVLQMREVQKTQCWAFTQLFARSSSAWSTARATS